MNTKFTTIIGLFAIFFFMSFHSNGQSFKRAELTSDWQLITQKDGIEIYVKEQHCDLNKNGKPVIFSMLKVVNTTNQQRSVTYDYIHQYDQGCDGCNGNPERIFTVDLKPNSEIEEDCSISHAGLALSIHNPNVTSTWKFESVSTHILSIK